MKKLFKIFTVVVPVLIIAVLITLYFSLNLIIKHGVETFGPKVTRTKVSLKESSISLFSGKGHLKGVFIGNPGGFKTESAFNLKEVKIAMKVSSVFSDRIIIDEIMVNAPEVTYEMSGKGNNIKIILNNVQSFAKRHKGASQKATRDKTKKVKKSEKKIQINNFIVKNGRVNMSMTMLEDKKISVLLPDIHIKNIGTEKEGKSASEVFEEILNVMNKNIGSAVSGLAKDVESNGKKAIDKLKRLFEK